MFYYLVISLLDATSWAKPFLCPVLWTAPISASPPISLYPPL